ncbi:BTAD domain-containing putative transcriptional regulator [uncultured Oscillibacter sp.]|uniref:BTAD domain-containing putative transcriptional regulator n=1 Tax=uncultured Oscillibacter sp. TaxID=876091 RepID=UPI0025EE9501|nr:BTAD domain-containing putative transcriptional regulator [uncultured Oscillibacter sp.]
MNDHTPSPVAAQARVTMLGHFAIEVDGQTITDETNRSQKQWSVLCYLIAHRDRTVSQGELIELFWPDEENANPANALKTLLYRARAALAPLFPPQVNPILSQRGSYSWNPAIRCRVDAETFEELCRRADDPELSSDARVELYAKAVELYRGDYLPKLSGQLWVTSVSAHYHALYIKAVKALGALLERSERYGDMEALCTAATQIDALDEDLHILMIRALLNQGKNAAALKHYQQATQMLSRALGIRPSQEMLSLYREIMDVEEALETDLEVIQQQLWETASRAGAYLCEYGFFREFYRLEVRRSARSRTSVRIALLSVGLPGGGTPPLPVLNETMDLLEDVLIHNLRQGDVIAKYSAAQFVLMLPGVDSTNSVNVMERIVSSFYRLHRQVYLKLSYKIRAL